jgi:hypothetical protein
VALFPGERLTTPLSGTGKSAFVLTKKRDFWWVSDISTSKDANCIIHVGFEVLTAVSAKMAVFWVLAPCGRLK